MGLDLALNGPHISLLSYVRTHPPTKQNHTMDEEIHSHRSSTDPPWLLLHGSSGRVQGGDPGTRAEVTGPQANPQPHTRHMAWQGCATAVVIECRYGHGSWGKRVKGSGGQLIWIGWGGGVCINNRDCGLAVPHLAGASGWVTVN